jgi:hypothetical protein
MRTYVTGILAGLATLALLAGCGGGGDASTAKVAKKTAAASEVDPAVAELVKNTTPATTLGSTMTPVEVRFAFAGVPAAGRPVDIDVAVLPQVAVPTVRVDLRPGDDGLRVVDPTAQVTFDKVQAGTIEKLRVQAIPERAGTTTLRLVVTLEQPTGQESRTFELPVVVPSPGSAPAPSGQTPAAPAARAAGG